MHPRANVLESIASGFGDQPLQIAVVFYFIFRDFYVLSTRRAGCIEIKFTSIAMYSRNMDWDNELKSHPNFSC